MPARLLLKKVGKVNGLVISDVELIKLMNLKERDAWGQKEFGLSIATVF